jgi:non-specific serine/threonine protein kinase
MIVAAGSSLPTPSWPICRTDLIGRGDELAIIRSMLLEEAAPVVTLTGPGGVGKTRLALAVAEDVAGAFIDRVVWVELAAVHDPSVVMATGASALSLTASDRRPLREDVTQALRTRQLLLLLDNCKHIVGAVADLVAHLLAWCPAVQVLATSRRPFARARRARASCRSPPTAG